MQGFWKVFGFQIYKVKFKCILGWLKKFIWVFLCPVCGKMWTNFLASPRDECFSVVKYETKWIMFYLGTDDSRETQHISYLATTNKRCFKKRGKKMINKCFQVIVLKEGWTELLRFKFKKNFCIRGQTASTTFIKTIQHFNFVSCLGIVLLLKVWQLTSNHNKIDYKVILSNSKYTRCVFPLNIFRLEWTSCICQRYVLIYNKLSSYHLKL